MPKDDDNQSYLRDYIKQHYFMYSRQHIKKSLIEAGYEEDDIEDAFASAQLNATVDEPEFKTRSGCKIAALFVVGMFVVFLVLFGLCSVAYSN